MFKLSAQYIVLTLLQQASLNHQTDYCKNNILYSEICPTSQDLGLNLDLEKEFE